MINHYPAHQSANNLLEIREKLNLFQETVAEHIENIAPIHTETIELLDASLVVSEMLFELLVTTEGMLSEVCSVMENTIESNLK